MDEIDGSFAAASIMIYAIIFALFAISVFGMAVFIERRFRANENSPFKKNGDIFAFSNRGDQITSAVELQPGTYKLQYQFSTGVSVKIDLISLDDRDSETLVIKSGTGSQAFRIKTSGRYAFRVEPLNEQSEWFFEISPLGLPSRR